MLATVLSALPLLNPSLAPYKCSLAVAPGVPPLGLGALPPLGLPDPDLGKGVTEGQLPLAVTSKGVTEWLLPLAAPEELGIRPRTGAAELVLGATPPTDLVLLTWDRVTPPTPPQLGWDFTTPPIQAMLG